MIKKIAWNTFKNTGDINTFLELKEIENLEKKKDVKKDIEENGQCKNEWNNTI